MNEPTITCPSCKSDIKLTESLAGPLVEQTRRAFIQQLNEKDQLVADAKAEVAAEKKRVEQERQAIDTTVAERLDEARKQIAADEAERAKRVVAADNRSNLSKRSSLGADAFGAVDGRATSGSNPTAKAWRRSDSRHEGGDPN